MCNVLPAPATAEQVAWTQEGAEARSLHRGAQASLGHGR